MRTLRTLCLHKYLISSQKVDGVSNEEDAANKECIVNYLLSRMDVSTVSYVESKLKVKIGNYFDLEYEPHKLWSIVREKKFPTSEAAKFHIDNELDDFRQDKKTSLEDHITQFRDLKDELIPAGGELTDGQLARRLIKSLHSNYHFLINNIFDNVKPLTYDGVDEYLTAKESELKNIPQYKLLGQNQSVKTNAHAVNRFGARPKCSVDKCVCKYGIDECFENPKNKEKKLKWQRDLIKSGRWRGTIPSHLSQSKGSSNHVEELTDAMNSMAVQGDDNGPIAFNTEYVCSYKAYKAKVPSSDYALADTGSSHHMFNELRHFDKSTLYPNPEPEKRLNMAGGKETLLIEQLGTAHFADTHGNLMTFENALYIPTLNKNLIAAGALIKKGVLPAINKEHPHLFTLTIQRKTLVTLFNGFFSGNLMVLKLLGISDTQTINTSNK